MRQVFLLPLIGIIFCLPIVIYYLITEQYWWMAFQTFFLIANAFLFFRRIKRYRRMKKLHNFQNTLTVYDEDHKPI